MRPSAGNVKGEENKISTTGIKSPPPVRTKFGIVSCLLLLYLFSCFAAVTGQDLKQNLTLGRQLELQGNISAAKKLYETLYKKHPFDLAVFSRLRDIYLKEGNKDKALDMINHRLQRYPADVSLQIAQAHIHYKQGKIDEALQQWESIMEKNPRNQAAFIRIANAMLEERLIDEAVNVYLIGKEKSSNPAVFSFYLANIYASRLQFREAVKELLLHLRSFPNQSKLIESQFLRYLKSGASLDDIRDEIDTYLDKHQGLTVLHKIMSSLYLEMENFKAALNAAVIFEKSVPPEKSGRGLYEFAHRAFTLGHVQIARDAFNTLLEDFPNFKQPEQAWLGRAQCYEALNKFREAGSDYQHIIESFPQHGINKTVLLKLARLQYEKMWLLPEAEETCRTLIRKYPVSREAAEGRLMLGKLLLSEGKTASADTVFSKLALQYKNKMDQSWIEAIAMLARTRFYRHQFTGAVEALTELTENQLNQTALKAPALNDALELKLFISHYREISASGLIAFATASLLEYRRFYQEAVDTLDLFLNSSADSLFLPEAYALKAGLLIKAGRDRQALEMLETVTTKYSNHSITDNLLYTAAEIAMRLKKFKDAVRYYETILVSHPGSLFTDRARQQIRKIEDDK